MNCNIKHYVFCWVDEINDWFCGASQLVLTVNKDTLHTRLTWSTKGQTVSMWSIRVMKPWYSRWPFSLSSGWKYVALFWHESFRASYMANVGGAPSPESSQHSDALAGDSVNDIFFLYKLPVAKRSPWPNHLSLICKYLNINI